MLLGIYTCREALGRLDDYLDRELTEEEIRRVERHLKICHACTRKFALESAFVSEVRSKLSRITVPADLMSQISRALAGEDAEECGEPV